MSDLKKEYDEITEQRKKIIKEIKLVEQSEIIKKYFELKNKNENLYEKQLTLYKDMKEEEYDFCEHILVYSKIDCDRYEERTYKSCGCIKCGLDNSVLGCKGEWLPFHQKIMYDYLRKKHFRLRGSEIKIACDLDLAQAIYSKIKEIYSDIDDETAIKYFEIALDNIRNIKVSEERKTNRAKDYH